MKYVDLTVTLRDGMEVYPGDPEVKIAPVGEMPKDPCRLAALSLGSHAGTHMDAPAHMVLKGRTLDQVPVNHFFGRAQVFPGDTDFGQVDLTGLDFALLNFDWARKRSGGEFYQEYPAISSRNAAILSIAGLMGVGMDTPSVDNQETDLVNHHILLSSGLILVEGLCNLDKLGTNPFHFITLPMKWKNSDGAPCRAIAILEG